MTAAAMLCTVYKSPRQAGMYLYVQRQAKQSDRLARLPASLLQIFGEPQEVLTLQLHPQRKLASVNAEAVLEAIAAQGYFLQLPPQESSHQKLSPQESSLQQSACHQAAPQEAPANETGDTTRSEL